MQLPLTTYNKLCTEFYDLDKPTEHSEEFLFFMHYAQQAHGPILEPMCGTGRFLIPMLQAGLDIEGFDASSHMLETLKQKYKTVSPLPAHVWQEFMQDFKSSKLYNLIFIPFGSWGLITDRTDAQRGLESLYRCLAPNGKLLLEIDTITSLTPPIGGWRHGTHTRLDGSHIALSALTSYDPETQIYRALCRYKSIVEGVTIEVEEEDFRQYLYNFEEMDAHLKNVGFTVITKYQDFRKTIAINRDTPRLVYECIKTH